MNKRHLKFEALLLFVGIPLLFLAPISPYLITTGVLSAFLYTLVLSIKLGLLSKAQLVGMTLPGTNKSVLFRFALFAVFSTILMAMIFPQDLFKVVMEKPLLWLAICVFYSIFSVYPQEFLYRHFFFARYRALIAQPYLFMLFNASLFCFAHIMFMNTLVFALTFLGGLMFAQTYRKKQSLMLVSVEHSLYGIWLFTLGLGDMLAFPS